MNYIIISNNIITIISFIVNLFFLIPFIKKIYKYFTQKRYIKKVLLYNSEPVQIYQSVRDYITIEGFEYEVITYNSLKSVNNILNMLAIINQDFILIDHDDTAKNEICIGGFLYNKRVDSYLSNYFENFKYFIDLKYKSFYEKKTYNTRILEYSNDKTGFYINEDLFLETTDKKDYAFLIKLTPDDFNTGNNKTVHILFGGKLIGEIKATEYLRTQYREIYRKYKNKHYFFAVEINVVDNSFNHKRGIIDLTDKMFKPLK